MSITGIAVFFFLINTVVADPVLDVSVAPELVLLGGQASYTVSVTNTDSNDKGYNLSFSSVFSSDRANPEGQVTFHSASDSRGELAPSSSVTDLVTGDTTIEFLNIKDLAPNETYTFTLTVDMSGDATWEAMDDLIHNITATVNTMPDGSGSDVEGTASDTSDVLPIALVDKIVHQSTGVEQATGTIDRPYEYEIDVQNNYTNATDSVVVTDTLPDGIEYLGVTSGHSCTDTRDNATGITTIVCNLGTMAPGAHEEIHFDAGIRYDYFGTDNGGTNRIHDDFDGTPATGTPIPDKTVLTNHVDLAAQYQGSAITTQSDDAPVTAAYATISKSANISDGGNGDTVNYTLTYITSEYYNIIDDDANDNSSSITIHDILPDGQTYITGSASPTPTNTITENGDGTTDIYWNSSVLNALAHSSSFNVTFSATIDNTWNNGTQIVAADRMTNTVDSHGEWDDQVDTARANAMTNSSASAGFGMETPQITKEVEDPNNPGTWIDATDAVVGDTMRFRVRFNTNDGANPVVSNINLGNIVVTDWLPPGMSYNNDAVETYSASSDFTDGGNPDTESAVTIGSLNGVEWTLGDISQGGWWQAIFTASVADSSSVVEGVEVNNIWKMTGENSFGQAYSDRDTVAVSYHDPHLVLEKNITNVPNPLKPGDTIEYTVTVNNTGQAIAKDILFKDVVDDFMNDTTPTVSSITLNGTALTEGTDYVTPTFNSGTREFAIDFSDGAIETNIPVAGTLIIVYQVTVDSDAGVGQSLDNIATVSYNTQSDGSGRVTTGTTNVGDDNTDNATTQLSSLTATKNSSSGPYTIGDIITYNIETTVPQGQIAYWTELEDVFDMDGISYIAGSASLTDISGTPVTGAAFDVSTNPDPIITTVGSNRTSLLWNLANPIDNRGQATDYVFRLSFNVRYTGLEDNGTDWEFFPPTANDQIGNTATVGWADYPAGSRTTNHDVNTNTVAVNIDQPLLSTTKTITSAGPYTAGSSIDYQVVITNTGHDTAYDITWGDAVTTFVDHATLTSVTHSVDGTLVSGTDFQENFGSNPLSIDFDGGSSDTNLAPGEIITILYSTTLGNDVGAGSHITNTEDVDWSSQDGVVSGERVYDDPSSENAYTDDTDTANATIGNASIVKSIVAPTSGSAEIGETIDYRLRVTVPAETVLYSPTIRDVITTDGMEFVNGSTQVALVSGNPETAATISAAPTVDSATPTPGATITFTFDNDIDNANSGTQGDTDYVFDVTYQMIVTEVDDAGNWISNPSSSNNTATLQWSDGSSNHFINDTANLTIVYPHLALTKNFDVENVSGGDTITATVTITNNGTGTAYELDSGADFTDIMPDGFTNPQIVSVTHSSNGALASPADYTFTATGNDFEIEYNSANTDLAPGETLTITYTTDIDPLIGAGVNISNLADVDYSSMSGNQPHERVFDDTNPNDGTDDQDSDNVITANATMTKTTSLGANEATIGENFDYLITVDVPQNTTVYNASIQDTIPDGLTVTGTSQTPNIGTVTATEQPDGTTPITWDIGDVSNNPVDQIILTIHVRVDNNYSNGDLLDGLPVGIDGDGQDVLTNNGVFNWDDADVSGTNHIINDAVDTTIVEPHPTITKDVNNNTAGIGDTMQYTVTIANNGTSTLYNINWNDTLPAELFDAPNSPTLVSVTHSTDGLLVEGTDYSSDFSVNPVTINFNVNPETSLDPGESVIIRYDAEVENTVHAGNVLTNNTNIVNSSSQPSSNPNGRSYNGSDSESITIATTSIGDKVWYDKNGNGLQDVGENGIANIAVHLLDNTGTPMDDPLNPGTPYVVQTNANGEYLFSNLSAGDYQIHFDYNEYALSPKDQGGDEAVDSDVNIATGTTDTFTLTHDEHITNIDAGFIPGSIRGLTWVDVNGDGIQNGGDTWQTGVTVRLLDENGNAVDDPLNPGTPYVVLTNGAGGYIFENLPAGNYQVQFDVPTGFNTTSQDQGSDDNADSDVNTTGRTSIISLAAGETNNTIDAGFYEPVSMGNFIWEDMNANGVQDTGENGIEGVTLNLLDNSGNPVDDPNNPGTPYTVVTGADGSYVFENLIPGDYVVEVIPPAMYNISPQSQGGDVTVDSDFSSVNQRTSIITLNSGDTTADIDSGLYRTASIGDKVWRDDERDGIQADWEPGLEGVTVELLDGSGNPVDNPNNPGTAYTVVTETDGNYIFENLTPGDYQVKFTPPSDHNPSEKNQGGDDTKDSDIDTTTLTTDTITVVSGAINTITDAGFYALYANVFDPPTALKTVNEIGENEIEWEMVWINNGNMTAIAAQILDDIPTGTTYIPDSFVCDARGNSSTTICVYDAMENRVRWEGNIDYDEGATDESNAPNAVVLTYRTTVPTELKRVSNQARAFWDANGDGVVTDDIARGQSSVLSNDPDTGESSDATVWIRNTGTGTGSIGNYIWLDRDGDGRQDKDEEGLENIHVKLTWAGPDGRFGTDDDKVWRTDTNHNGHYLFENLPAGKYKVKVRERDVAKYIQTYEHGSNLNNQIEITLRDGKYYKKADFGYMNEEAKLAKTGDNIILWLITILITIITGFSIRKRFA